MGRKGRCPVNIIVVLLVGPIFFSDDILTVIDR